MHCTHEYNTTAALTSAKEPGLLYHRLFKLTIMYKIARILLILTVGLQRICRSLSVGRLVAWLVGVFIINIVVVFL